MKLQKFKLKYLSVHLSMALLMVSLPLAALALAPAKKQKLICVHRPDLPARTLSFPEKGWAIGHLFLFRYYRWQNIDQYHDAIQDLGPAKGTVKIPAGRCLGLLVTPEGLANLDALKKLAPNDLQLLLIQTLPFTSNDLDKVKHLTGLEKLELMVTDVDNKGLEKITHFKNLRSLFIRNSRLKSPDLSVLTKLTKLKELTLNHNEIRDTGIKSLSNNKAIVRLQLSKCRLTTKSIDYILKMQQLKLLKLVGNKMKDEDFLKLTKLKNLKHLEIGENQITKQGVKQFKKLRPRCTLMVNSVDPYY